MANDIDNNCDVIDSRDVIERLEELESVRKPFTAGFNMPGYMPDNEPAGFETWQDAADYIVGEMERAFDEIEAPTEEQTEEFEAAKSTAEDSDSVKGFGLTYGQFHYWITESAQAFDDPDDAEEYAKLKAFAEEFENYAPDYHYGEAAVRDSYFKEYAMQLAEDIGAVKDDATWPNNCIDWDQAAREPQVDYTAIEFDGVTYWTR